MLFSFQKKYVTATCLLFEWNPSKKYSQTILEASFSSKFTYATLELVFLTKMKGALVEVVNVSFFCWQFAESVIIYDELLQTIGVFGFFWKKLSRKSYKVMTQEYLTVWKWGQHPVSSKLTWPLCNNLFEWKIFNINRIGRAWYQIICKWGQRIQIWHSFLKIFI